MKYAVVYTYLNPANRLSIEILREDFDTFKSASQYRSQLIDDEMYFAEDILVIQYHL